MDLVPVELLAPSALSRRSGGRVVPGAGNACIVPCGRSRRLELDSLADLTFVTMRRGGGLEPRP
jgi:hypothetical protein